MQSAKTSTADRSSFGDIYPPDDLLSEWLATIAMAANDLIAVHGLMAEAEDDSLRWYYFRPAVGHFYEAAKHLDETEDLAAEGSPNGFRGRAHRRPSDPQCRNGEEP
jgi:hypothetical protein